MSGLLASPRTAPAPAPSEYSIPDDHVIALYGEQPSAWRLGI